jgi:hypothetical protein
MGQFVLHAAESEANADIALVPKVYENQLAFKNLALQIIALNQSLVVFNRKNISTDNTSFEFLTMHIAIENSIGKKMKEPVNSTYILV